MAKKPDPSQASSDYLAMVEEWTKIQDVRNGITAVRLAGTKYLAQFADESFTDYNRRVAAAPWRPEFTTALESICAKPFTKEVNFANEQVVPDSVRILKEDIDGRGNSLHVFAGQLFLEAVSLGVAAIYVTFSSKDPALTRADEVATGARPYWVPYSALDILALYTRWVGAREVVEHVRLRADEIAREGFKEVTHRRVRVLEHLEGELPTSTLWEYSEDAEGWTIKEGPINLDGVDTIPFVPFFTGERGGNHRVKSPMADLAEMQMEIYRCLARKEEIQNYVGFPMLKAVGMAPPAPLEPGGPTPAVPVGPRAILYALPGDKQTDWDFVQPNAANLKELREDLESVTADFRRLSRQPMTQWSGILTATGEAIRNASAHSAVKSWANGLKDALEQAFVYTAQWMDVEPNVEVFVNTDFETEIDGGADMAELLKARTVNQISRETYWDELTRRGKLGPQFDPVVEAQRLESAGETV